MWVETPPAQLQPAELHGPAQRRQQATTHGGRVSQEQHARAAAPAEHVAVGGQPEEQQFPAGCLPIDPSAVSSAAACCQPGQERCWKTACCEGAPTSCRCLPEPPPPLLPTTRHAQRQKPYGLLPNVPLPQMQATVQHRYGGCCRLSSGVPALQQLQRAAWKVSKADHQLVQRRRGLIDQHRKRHWLVLLL